MRFSSAVVLASLVAAGSAQAQGGGGTAHTSCTGPAGNACQQAVDFFGYMAPQLGTAVTGGNTTLAQGGNIGTRLGFMPKFVVGVRVNAVLGSVPADFSPAAGAPAQNTIATKSFPLPMPSIDVAAGVFKGIPMGLTSVGGVDLIASIAYIKKVTTDEINVTPDKSTAVGYGLRVGILQEGLTVPGVGFSILQRKLPKTTLATTGTNAQMSVNGMEVKSTAWRLTVSKSLILVGLAAGVGQDKYSTDVASIAATQGGNTVTTPALKSEVTRTNYFADASMNLLVLKLVATGGMVSGGDITTYNGYDKPADKSRMYASFGVRIGL